MINEKLKSIFTVSPSEALFSYLLSIAVFSVFKLLPPFRPYAIIITLVYLPVISAKVNGFDYIKYGLSNINLKKSVMYFLLWSFVIFPPYFVLIFYFKFSGDCFYKLFNLKIPKDILYFWVYNTVVVGISEEFFYRGYIQALLEKKYNFELVKFLKLNMAVILTSVMFSIGHFLTYFTVFSALTFFPSVIFGILKNQTNNIVASVFFHGLSNTVLYVIVYNIGKIV